MTRKAMTLAAFVTVFAISVTISALASASMTLPSFSGTAATEGKISAGKTVLSLPGEMFSCESASGATTFEGASRRSGPFSLDIIGCKQSGEECRSLGDALGTFLITGTWHLVLFVKSSLDGHYLLLSPRELHTECPHTFVKLVLFAGSVLGSTATHAGSTTEFGLTIRAPGGGQEFTEYENEAGTAVTATLLSSPEGGKFKAAGLETEDMLLKFNGATGIEN
jgi:hypothetical protein